MRTLVLGLVIAFASTAVVAQTNKKKEAEKFFRAGEKAFNASRYAMAAQAFEEAYKRLSAPAIAFSAAQSYRLQYFIDKKPRNLKRAVELYRAYLAAVTSGGRRGDAVANLAELEPILQRLEVDTQIDTSRPQASVTKLLITAEVDGAKVRVNGAAAVAMPFAREVKAGKYRIQVEVPGYFAFDESREVFQGQFRVVEVALRPKPAKVRVKTESGATVRVDGRVAKGEIEVPAGTHWVTVRKRGRESVAKEVTLKRGQELELDAELASTPQRRLALVVMGVSGVTFLTSGGLLLAAASSNGKASDLLDVRDESGLTLTQLDRYRKLRDERDDRLRSSYIFAGIGAAIGTAGVLMYLLDTPAAPERPSAGTTVVPVAIEGGVGAVVSGSF